MSEQQIIESSNRVSPQDEMQILAMIARNDKRDAIAEQFNISPKTVTEIKKRNPDTLKIITDQITAHRQSQADKILDKANKAIEKKLDEDGEFEKHLEEYKKTVEDLNSDLAENLISKEVHKSKMSIAKAKLASFDKLSVTELTSISREMHTQTKNQVHSPVVPNVDNEAYLIELGKAIENGDEVVMERLIFNRSSDE